MIQEEVIALAKTVDANIVETHISWVLLAKKFAYKIKKPLKTSFLDFSTISLRKKFCFKELEINKKLTSSIYLEVLSVIQTEGVFSFASKNAKAIEYAVKMKRLDSSRQMNSMLSKSKVTKIHIRALAKEISRFHATTKISKKQKSLKEMENRFNDLLSLKEKILQIFEEGRYGKLEKSVKKVNAFLENNFELFISRPKEGWVRDCHGDLHSGNIFLYPKPILFDRIEFSEQFRQIDVLHEIAFLCMDLEAFGKNTLSKELLSHYIKFSKIDFGKKEEAIFNYYKCYTANVRAKVTLLGLKNKKDVGEVKKYLEIMERYAKLL